MVITADAAAFRIFNMFHKRHARAALREWIERAPSPTDMDAFDMTLGDYFCDERVVVWDLAGLRDDLSICQDSRWERVSSVSSTIGDDGVYV
jgi:hypothetical protein